MSQKSQRSDRRQSSRHGDVKRGTECNKSWALTLTVSRGRATEERRKVRRFAATTRHVQIGCKCTCFALSRDEEENGQICFCRFFAACIANTAHRPRSSSWHPSVLSLSAVWNGCNAVVHTQTAICEPALMFLFYLQLQSLVCAARSKDCCCLFCVARRTMPSRRALRSGESIWSNPNLINNCRKDCSDWPKIQQHK